ncbi:MAG: hypothetical protein GY941_21825 [Planctomycetes bacterium]|nr:hypothetical protein [Planctomycetota bacterium]
MTWVVVRGRQYLYCVVNERLPIWCNACHAMRYDREDDAVEAAVMFNAVARQYVVRVKGK